MTESSAVPYARAKRRLWLAETALSAGLLAGWIASPLSAGLGTWVRAQNLPWPAEVLLYTGTLWLLIAAAEFPLDFLRGFRLEHRFGLSKQSFPDWLKDYGKGLAVTAVLGTLLVLSLSALLRGAPRLWWAQAALVWTAGSVFLARVAPQWLIPLFYRQRPLSDPRLKRRLEAFLERSGAPVRNLFEIDFSRKTAKANACLCGLGKSRRVLLSDTLIDRYPPEEVEVVLAHELGHHRLRHMPLLIAAGAGAVFLGFFAADRAARIALAPLGIAGLSSLETLPVIGLALGIALFLLNPLLNALSRSLEAQADRFALDQTGNASAFASAMRRLGGQNLAEWNPPRWVEWLLYDHPPIAKRIAMAER